MSMKLTAQALDMKIGSPITKLVLVCMADIAGKDGTCFPSYQHIADQCEISKRSVIEHIKKLEALGLISKQERKTQKGNSSNIYRVTLPSESPALHGEPDSPPSEPNSPPPSESPSPRTSNPSEPLIEPKEKKQKKKFILPEWIDSEIWDEWMYVRKQKKAVNSPRAMQSLLASLEQILTAGHDPNKAIELAITKSWKTVELEYLQNNGGQSHETSRPANKPGNNNAANRTHNRLKERYQRAVGGDFGSDGVSEVSGEVRSQVVIPYRR